MIVGSGSYTVGKPVEQYEVTNLDVHGAFGAPMPKISGSSEGTLLTITGAKDRVSYLEVVSEGNEIPGGIGCSTEGLVERVVARASGEYALALLLGNNCTVRDSLLLAGGQESAAIRAAGFGPGLIGVARRT